ncbi:hypothetical protein J7I93_11905 [Bacillus sp. ISL-47]|uniref:CBO0543 family protein n=1 Tax=Bacillus sp. ISL-47 TaxID=2819130 RepID=UPI001BE8FFC1|nr:CBO0543 family protein [Bacillus sp. ISL-47]MBT2688888.1 hypothetical protein [Bacillus sp. ISL-47]MBT2709087.1 hypothetical protein [Pseudomonas sp. ISL-84]
MTPKQEKFFQKLVSLQEELASQSIEYWEIYSHLGTWQFWTVAVLLIGPLILVYFKIDRKHIFQIGFFGFAVHILFAYVDAAGIRFGLWGYPYQLLPFIPSFSLDAAIIPVFIMLVYQWTLKHKKNYYLYAFLTALAFGFGFKPLLVAHGLFEKYKWVNYIYIFFIYIILFLMAYWLTRIFQWMQRRESKRKPGAAGE